MLAKKSAFAPWLRRSSKGNVCSPASGKITIELSSTSFVRGWPQWVRAKPRIQGGHRAVSCSPFEEPLQRKPVTILPERHGALLAVVLLADPGDVVDR